MQLLLLILRDKLNQLGNLSEIVFANIDFVFFHSLKQCIYKPSFMLVIIKLLERFQECLGFQLVNTFFKKMKTLIIKHISVKFFAVRLFLKFINNSHILKRKEDDVGLNLFLRDLD
jgi:hypothetical protein